MAPMPGAEVMGSRGEDGGRHWAALSKGVMSEFPISCSTLAGVTGGRGVRGRYGGKAVLACRKGKEERLRWDIGKVEAVGLAHGANTDTC